MTKFWKFVPFSFWDFYPRNSQKFWFFQNGVYIYILYLVILSTSYHIWRFCIILTGDNFLATLTVWPGFLHVFFKKICHNEFLLATITVSMATDGSFKFAHDVGNLYINFYSSISCIWNVMNRYVDLGDHFNLWSFLYFCLSL